MKIPSVKSNVCGLRLDFPRPLSPGCHGLALECLAFKFVVTDAIGQQTVCSCLLKCRHGKVEARFYNSLGLRILMRTHVSDL